MGGGTDDRTEFLYEDGQINRKRQKEVMKWWTFRAHRQTCQSGPSLLITAAESDSGKSSLHLITRNNCQALLAAPCDAHTLLAELRSTIINCQRQLHRYFRLSDASKRATTLFIYSTDLITFLSNSWLIIILGLNHLFTYPI